ncbi:hypothetical protein [Rhizobium mesosinicum]|uniref:Uncharacterized protein n=1 Tax=Rhizobium mesosinicum TaxID=335017 RepID=A0ABS7GMA7_9HYPH|nr:hypothetical protein [Rhizobium mesosinicum]MBW9051110.1 hypothetical protein [Rhizobium mesosinicum]
MRTTPPHAAGNWFTATEQTGGSWIFRGDEAFLEGLKMKPKVLSSLEPVFLGDDPAMDFLNSIRKLDDARSDSLANSSGLIQWMMGRVVIDIDG